MLKKQDVNIIIALGHSGFSTDQEIAKKCPHVDIVIGGHSNTFLYTDKKPSIEEPEGPYPVVVKQLDGKRVPVVQAYAYTKYLGKLKVKFDSKGNLKEFNGEPILLDPNTPQDKDVLDLLEKYRPNITELEHSVIGHTAVTLEGSSKICRTMECNLGNLVADSMVYARAREFKETTLGFWTDAAIAFIQGGGIRASIEKKDDGVITKNDILSVLPFQNNLYVVNVTGKVIRNALERSASKLDDVDNNGGFLQMSGVQVTYDANESIGNRVKSVQLLCATCDVPHYVPLDDEKYYNVILSTFLLNGGDGYIWSFDKDILKKSIQLKAGDVQAVADYIESRSPVYAAVESRITIENPKTKNSAGRIVIESKLGIITIFLLFLSTFY